jgi:hypothetical protein
MFYAGHQGIISQNLWLIVVYVLSWTPRIHIPELVADCSLCSKLDTKGSYPRTYGWLYSMFYAGHQGIISHNLWLIVVYVLCWTPKDHIPELMGIHLLRSQSTYLYDSINSSWEEFLFYFKDLHIFICVRYLFFTLKDPLHKYESQVTLKDPLHKYESQVHHLNITLINLIPFR